MKKNQYIEFLIHTPTNYTGTALAEHAEKVSHDSVSRFLSKSRSTARDIWNLSKQLITNDEKGYLIADDSVQNKQYSQNIELVKHQYSGAAHGLVRGIGIVNLVHSDGKDYYPIDYRIYAPDQDGKTKNDHFQDMLIAAKHDKHIQSKTVLMDSWYASLPNLKLIHRMNMVFFTTLKTNRLVSLSKEGGYVHLEEVKWTKERADNGLLVKLKKLPFKVKLFKLVAPNGNIDWIITNCPDRTLKTKVVEAKNKVRWKIEQFHREVKNVVGSEKCQSRKGRSQRNHIAYCYQAWLSLKVATQEVQKSIYRLKSDLLSEYLRSVMKQPIIPVYVT